MPSLMICIAARDEVKTEFMMSLCSMMQHCALYPPDGLTGMGFNVIRSSILPSQRQTLAEQALESGVTHTLWIDTDMSFPKDTTHRLLAFQREIVGINARSRRPPFGFTGEVEPYKRMITSKDSRGIVKAHRVGFGLIMIRREVFEKLEWPYFDFEKLPDQKKFRGEDYYFCEKARAAGFQMWIDHDLSKEVGHIGDFAFMPVIDGGPS